MQKSVFEADLTAEELQAILQRAARFVRPQDSLRVYPMCAACRKGLRWIGQEFIFADVGLAIV